MFSNPIPVKKESPFDGYSDIDEDKIGCSHASEEGGVIVIFDGPLGLTRTTTTTGPEYPAIETTTRTFQRFLNDKSKVSFEDVDYVQYRKFEFSQITEKNLMTKIKEFFYNCLYREVKQGDKTEMGFYRQYLKVQKCYEKFSGKATNESYKALKAAFEKLHKDFDPLNGGNNAALINDVLFKQVDGNIAEELLDYCAKKALTKKDGNGVEDFGANFRAFFDPKKQMKQCGKAEEGYGPESKIITTFNKAYKRVLLQPGEKDRRLGQAAKAINEGFAKEPSVEEITSYKNYIEERLRKVIQSGKVDKSIIDVYDCTMQELLIQRAAKHKELTQERKELLEKRDSLRGQHEKEAVFLNKTKTCSYEVLNEIFENRLDNLPPGFEGYADLHREVKEKKMKLAQLEEHIEQIPNQIQVDYLENKGLADALSAIERLKGKKAKIQRTISGFKQEVSLLKKKRPKVNTAKPPEKFLPEEALKFAKQTEQYVAELLQLSKYDVLILETEENLKGCQAELDSVKKEIDQENKDLSKKHKLMQEEIATFFDKANKQVLSLMSEITNSKMEVAHRVMPTIHQKLGELLREVPVFSSGEIRAKYLGTLHNCAAECDKSLRKIASIDKNLRKNQISLSRNNQELQQLREDLSDESFFIENARFDDSEHNRQIDRRIDELRLRMSNLGLDTEEGNRLIAELESQKTEEAEVMALLDSEKVRSSLEKSRGEIIRPLEKISIKAVSPEDREIATMINSASDKVQRNKERDKGKKPATKDELGLST